MENGQDMPVKVLNGRPGYINLLDALNGWDPTGGCLYYYNPRATGDKWIRTRTVKTVIGNHSFAV
jgi:spore germination cell wall hydrolase CwlJ-like protein